MVVITSRGVGGNVFMLRLGKKGCLWGEDGGGGRRRPFGEEWRVRVTKTAAEAWLALTTSGAVKDEWPGMTRAK